MCVTINWREYIKSHVLNIAVTGNGYAFIIDANGRFIAHPNEDVHMADGSKMDFVPKALKMKNGSFDSLLSG